MYVRSGTFPIIVISTVHLDLIAQKDPAALKIVPMNDNDAFNKVNVGNLGDTIKYSYRAQKVLLQRLYKRYCV
jgi:hypothetical protein